MLGGRRLKGRRLLQSPPAKPARYRYPRGGESRLHRGRDGQSRRRRRRRVSLCISGPEDYSSAFGGPSIPRLGISIHLPDCVTQGDQIAARRFGSATGRVPRKFYLMSLCSKRLCFPTRSRVPNSSCPSDFIVYCTAQRGGMFPLLSCKCSRATVLPRGIM